jgi:hypothetical protein
VLCCAVQPTQRTLASPPGALGASFHTRRKPRLGCEICLLRLFGLFSGLTWLRLGVGLLIVVVWSGSGLGLELGLELWLGLGLGRSELTVIPNDWRRPPAQLASRGSTVFVNGSGLNSLLSWRLSTLSPRMEALPAGGLLSLDDAGLCLGLSCELSPGLRNELCWTKDGLRRFSRCRKDGLLNTVRANSLSLCAEVGVPLLGFPALNESESSLVAMAAAIRLSLAAFSSTFASNRALILAARLCDLTVALSIGDAAPQPGEAAEAGEISDNLDDPPLRSRMIWSDTLPTAALIIDAASVGSVQCAPFTESSRSPTRRPPR